MQKEKTKFTPKDMAYIALLVVLIAVCSWISIPSVVPFTMQTFGVFCAVGLLGGFRGTVAVLIYILMGLIGLRFALFPEAKALAPGLAMSAAGQP